MKLVQYTENLIVGLCFNVNIFKVSSFSAF